MSEKEEKKWRKVKFSITMNKETVERVDKERDNIPRSTYIEYMLRKAFRRSDEREENIG